ncbi:MAG: ABC transporter permease [Maribacter sp.]
MFKNHLKIAFRFFLKNKLFTGINILGLSIGISAFILLTRYVAFEKSYDRFIPQVDDLYRVTLTTNLGDGGFTTAATNHPALGPAMLQDFPEVENFTRIVNKNLVFSGTIILSYTNERGDEIKSDANDDHIYFADNAVMEIFDMQLNKGDPETALIEPNSMIMSQSIANRFFGNEDPIGKMIEINEGFKIQVTGVFKDRPQNTHMPMGMIVSYNIFGQGGDFANSWTWPEFYNYVKLKPGTTPQIINSKFPAFVSKYLGDIMKEYGFEAKLALQPVTDIHLKSNLRNEISANASQGTLYFLIIVAAFIILIAMINFVNLSTAKSMERAKEVGLKKVVGAQRGVLIWQFLCESLLINFFALLFSVVLVSLLIPSFNGLIGTKVLNLGMWGQWQVWLAMACIFISGGILAGLYPAFVLSGFLPMQVLRGQFKNSSKGAVLQKGLVIFQFAISIVLISGTYVVYNQFSYMQNQDLGFDANQNLVVPAPTFMDSTYQQKVETFRKELLQNPKINNATLSSEIPGRSMVENNGIRRSFEPLEKSVMTHLAKIDNEFFTNYGIPVLAGRTFSKDDATEYFDREKGQQITAGHRAILNRSAINKLGFVAPEKAIDQKVIFKYGPLDRTATIVGIVEDHHQQSLQKGFEPITYLYFDFFIPNYLTVNLMEQNVHQTNAFIETKYKEFFPNDL